MNNLTIPDEKKAAAPIARDIEEGCAYADSLAIESQEQYAYADRVLGHIAAKEKEVETIRKGLVKPFNEAVKTINGWFRPSSLRLAQAKNALKHKMLAYRAQVAAQTAKAQAVAAAAARAGQFEVVQQQAAQMAIAPHAAGSAVRKTWEFRVDDLAALPLEYHLPNEKVIRQAMRSMIDRGQTPELPGVTFYQQEGIAVR